MLLQNHGRFDVVAEFHPDTGRVDLLARPTGLAVTDTDGWFSILAGVCVVFFRRGGKLWLRVGDHAFDLDSGAEIEWAGDGRISRLRVTDHETDVILNYPSGPPFGPLISDDPTPFVAEEDWDLGLFVSNVVFDDERRDLVRQGSGEALEPDI